jgi:hypothetical protein
VVPLRCLIHLYFKFPIKSLFTSSELNDGDAPHFESRELSERRKYFRVEWNSVAKIYGLDGHFAARCIVSNFSNGGAKIIGIDPRRIAAKFILRISPHGHFQACHVNRRLEDGLAVEFTDSAKHIRELVTQYRKLRSAPLPIHDADVEST